jgi:hypothetical protein
VVFRPVADLSPSVISVVWPQASRSLATAAFVRAAVEVAAGMIAVPANTPSPE